MNAKTSQTPATFYAFVDTLTQLFEIRTDHAYQQHERYWYTWDGTPYTLHDWIAVVSLNHLQVPMRWVQEVNTMINAQRVSMNAWELGPQQVLKTLKSLYPSPCVYTLGQEVKILNKYFTIVGIESALGFPNTDISHRLCLRDRKGRAYTTHMEYDGKIYPPMNPINEANPFYMWREGEGIFDLRADARGDQS